MTASQLLMIMRRTSRKTFFPIWLATMLVLLIALDVSAQGSGFAPLVEGAKKEGKVVVYSTMNIDQSAALSKGFEKKHPFLKAEQVRISGGARFFNRIVQEASARQYLVDVINGTPVNLYLMKQKGLVASYKSSEPVPIRPPFGDSEGFAHPVYLMAFIVGYNTREVHEEIVPKAYEALLEPRWKGRICMGANLEWLPFMLAKMGEERGLAYMKRLADQKVQAREGDTLNATLLAAGECAIVLNVYSQTIESQKARGAPVDWIAINPTLAKAQVAAVASNAPHPNAARLYLDYVISKEGQTAIANLYRIPARSDVRSLSPRMEKGVVFEAQDLSWVVNHEIFDKYTKLFRDIFHVE